MDKAKERRGGVNAGFFEKGAYAMLSGGLGAMTSNPADLAMVRFQNDGLLPKSDRRNYKNFVDAMGRMLKEEGVSSLFKGSVANACRSGALTAG